jgi:hypothetical protein
VLEVQEGGTIANFKAVGVVDTNFDGNTATGTGGSG